MSGLIEKEAVEVFLREALFGAGCSVDQVDAAMKCVSSLVVVQNHTPAAPVPVEGLLRCEGCGNVTDDDQRDLAWIRRHGGISCCPERKMVPIMPAAPVGVPVAWQRLHPQNGWQPVDPEAIEHYRKMGQEIRSLYTHPAALALNVNPLDVEGLINIVLQEVHGPLWRSILSSEDCLNRVCADQSPESCICAPKIDRIENHARALAKARILSALEGGEA